MAKFKKLSFFCTLALLGLAFSACASLQTASDRDVATEKASSEEAEPQSCVTSDLVSRSHHYCI